MQIEITYNDHRQPHQCEVTDEAFANMQAVLPLNSSTPCVFPLKSGGTVKITMRDVFAIQNIDARYDISHDPEP
jgi:hypothetical protein